MISLARSYNEPKFCPSATWNPNAITSSNRSVAYRSPYDIFVDTSNTIYVADTYYDQIEIWLNDSLAATRPITSGTLDLYSIFVTVNKDMYVGNTHSSYFVTKFTLNTTSSTDVMTSSSYCFDVFVDISNTLYCSMYYVHTVVAKSLNSGSSAVITVAGTTNSDGSTSNLLCYPWGIFVDSNFDLYVADSANDRVQLFHYGDLNAITVAGDGSPTTTISLDYPRGVVLDADKYLFIVDQSNHRIVGSGPNGFRCLVGCSGTGGSASDQLYYPLSMAFDSYGNLLIADTDNGRIQKFILSTNSCSKYGIILFKRLFSRKFF